MLNSTSHANAPSHEAPLSQTYDVIVAGAGPVGLFLACELALAHCSVLVLEQAPDPHSPLKQLPFGLRGLSAPTIEALDRRGLLDALEVHKQIRNPHKTATPEGPRRQVGHFAGIPFLEGDIDTTRWQHRLPSSTPVSLISTMQEMESVLTRRAEELGVTIQRGRAITAFDQAPDGVTVHTSNSTFQGRWLVGCDGARSIVRKHGGFEFAGTEPEFTGCSLQLDLAGAEKLAPGRVLTPTGLYFQSQPGYLVMIEFDGGAGHRSEPVTREQIQAVLRRVSNTDVTIATLHAATTWTDRARQATSYRNGRVLLAGDAAHIHAPLGGQGLNLGLGDAMNLGWKLAATVHGAAPAGLLDSYQSERHPLGAQVLDWSRAQVAIMKPDPASRALNAIVRDLIGTRDGATYFAGRVWGIHTHYEMGDAHPLVGYSAPNFVLSDGTTLNMHLRTGKAVLLDFSADASLQADAEQWKTSVLHVHGALPQNGMTAALIRPDGIIAWASDVEPYRNELGIAAARWHI